MKRLFIIHYSLFISAALCVALTSCGELIEVNEVSEQQMATAKLEIERRTIDLTVGDSYNLTVKVTPDSLAKKGIYWESANPAVVTIDEGRIVAVAPGETVIKATAMAGLNVDSCRVRVLPVWTFDPYLFRYDMVVYANVTVGGRALDRDVTVAAFNSGGEVRGLGLLRQADGRQYLQLRVYSNDEYEEDGQLTLRCYDRQRLIMVEAKEKLSFEADATLGTLSSLYPIVFD